MKPGWLGAAIKRFFAVKPATQAACKLTIDTADRIEAAAKRIEEAADEFGAMASDMRGKRPRKPSDKTTRKRGPKKPC